jgi:type I restriction enzyme, S subunit
VTWPVVSLADVAEVRLGRQRSPKNHSGDSMRPYIRAANVKWTGLDLTDVKTMNFTDAELSTYRMQPGDIVLSEASGSPGEVGKPALWSGEIADCAFQNTLIRVRSAAHEPKFLLHYLRYQALDGRFVEHSRGVGIHHLGRARLASWPTPLPPVPEQRQIVELLESHLSGLDAAQESVRTAILRSSAMVKSSLAAAITAGSAGSPMSTVGAEAQLVEYGTGAKCRETPTVGDVPVLRMGNVKDGEIDWRVLKFLQKSHKDFPKLLLRAGDLLFNRTNSAELVGKSAVFESGTAASFASYLIRVRFKSTVDPQWANIVINSPQGRAYIASVASQQVGQANVNGTKLKAFPLPIPSLARQRELVHAHQQVLEAARRLNQSAEASLRSAASLRHALLADAFSGRLSVSKSHLAAEELIGARD